MNLAFTFYTQDASLRTKKCHAKDPHNCVRCHTGRYARGAHTTGPGAHVNAVAEGSPQGASCAQMGFTPTLKGSSYEIRYDGRKYDAVNKDYTDEVRALVHGLKEGDTKAIQLAAQQMVREVSWDAKAKNILIPIPSRKGYATTTLRLAQAIIKEAERLGIHMALADILKCEERPRLYDKKQGGIISPETLKMKLADDISPFVKLCVDGNVRVHLIDHVIGTGVTTNTALSALKKLPQEVRPFIQNVKCRAYAFGRGMGKAFHDATDYLKQDYIQAIQKKIASVHEKKQLNDRERSTVYQGLVKGIQNYIRGENTIRNKWPKDFPFVMCQTTRENIEKLYPHLFYVAKAGRGDEAKQRAEELMRRIVKNDKITALAKRHPHAKLVSVHAEEMEGRNRLPMAYADYIAEHTGLQVEPRIVQSVRSNHTGATELERLTRPVLFDGPVKRGQEYILIDDHCTDGGTLNALRNYIENKGGKVVEATVLTLSRFSSRLSPKMETLNLLKEKTGGRIDEFLKKTGICESAEHLTEKQARLLLRNARFILPHA